ncbi:MAG: hypothetical protein JWQ09_4301 [Segetibacter sp.]|nr:hypothetical protein [Segetibacter sp.]
MKRYAYFKIQWVMHYTSRRIKMCNDFMGQSWIATMIHRFVALFYDLFNIQQCIKFIMREVYITRVFSSRFNSFNKSITLLFAYPLYNRVLRNNNGFTETDFFVYRRPEFDLTSLPARPAPFRTGVTQCTCRICIVIASRSSCQ